jgi:plastocyanin
MSRTRISLALVTVALVAAVGAGSALSAVPTLIGNTGPDTAFKITLTQGGKAVKTLKKGTYKIVVKDTASTHNFHLIGPGLNKSTSVSGKGTTTWTVTLKPGKYTYVCDPHASLMKGSFTVK